MLNKCIYSRVRHKKGQIYYYCTKIGKIVEKTCYMECLNKEYKKAKPIKKLSKKRLCVSNDTYNKVFVRDKGRCRLCGSVENLHLHHIMGRGKDKTDNPKNCIMLCQKCHLNVVHANNKKYRPILLEMVNNEEN